MNTLTINPVPFTAKPNLTVTWPTTSIMYKNGANTAWKWASELVKILNMQYIPALKSSI